MGDRIVEVIIKAKDLASGVVKSFASGFEKNLRAVTRVGKAVAKDLVAIGAGAGAAIFGLEKLSERGAQVAGVQQAFTRLTDGETGALERLRAASLGAASDFDLMAYSNQAMALGAAQSSSDFARLVSIATKLSKSLGVDVKYGIESLTTGIGRQSKMFLDNIGILIDAEKVNKAYAKALGVNVSTLTDAQKKEAFRNEALRQGEELTKRLGGSTTAAAEASARFAAALINIRDYFAQIIVQSPRIAAFFDGMAKTLQEMAGLDVGQAAISASIANITDVRVLEARLKGVNDEIERTTQSIADLHSSKKGHLLDAGGFEALQAELATLKQEAEIVQNRLDDLSIGRGGKAGMRATLADLEANPDLANSHFAQSLRNQLGIGKDSGGGAGAARAPAITGGIAELKALRDAIKKTDEDLKAAKLDQLTAAPGDEAEKAATKVKGLADEYARLVQLAQPFGGLGGLTLLTSGITPVNAGLINMPRVGISAPTPAPYTLGGAPKSGISQVEDAGVALNDATGVVVDSFDRMASAAVTGSATMEQAVISSLQQIIANIKTSSGASFGSTLLGGVVGIGIGLIGSLFHKNRDPVPVTVTDFSSRAEAKLKDRKARPYYITRIYQGTGTAEQRMKEDLDLEQRDAVFRGAKHGGVTR